MKQERNRLRRAACVLLAATALPLTPLAAQETAPAVTTPPVVEAPPAAIETTAPATAAPAPAPVSTPAPTMEPVVNTTPSGNEPGAAAPRTTARAPAPAVVHTAARSTAAHRTSTAPARAEAPAPAPAEAPAPTPVPVAEVAPTPPVAAPAPAPAPVASADNAQPASSTSTGSMLLWALGGLIIIGALAYLLSRRRREEDVVYDTVAQEPVVTSDYEPMPVTSGMPELHLDMRPRRAGVREEDAVVEFTLAVENRGSVPARDVRVATWMFQSGTSSSADMEQMLIRPHATKLSDAALAPGATKTVESSVRLRTSEIDSDSLLPVVVAEARYRDANGVEQTVQQSFAVGVPYDGELAHFDVENPSGLHEEVEAREIA